MDELDFQAPEGASERLRPRAGAWSKWFAELDRQPRFAGVWSGSEVCGREGAKLRIGGYFVEPVESVLGLRPFRDTLEGTVELEGIDEQVPYVFFEFEKVVRMMLHDSDLALEVLSTPHWLEPPDPESPCAEPRRIVRHAISRGVAEGFRERAQRAEEDHAAGAEPEALLRPLATGAALAEGRVTLELGDALQTVGETWDGDGFEELVGRLRERLEEAADSLPETAPAYETLNEWLVEMRLAHRAEAVGDGGPA